MGMICFGRAFQLQSYYNLLVAFHEKYVIFFFLISMASLQSIVFPETLSNFQMLNGF